MTDDPTGTLPKLSLSQRLAKRLRTRKVRLSGDGPVTMTINDTRFTDPVVVNVGPFPAMVQRGDVLGIMAAIQSSGEEDAW